MVTQAKLFVGGDEWSLNKALEICIFATPKYTWNKNTLELRGEYDEELGYIDINTEKYGVNVGRLLGTELLKRVIHYPQFRRTIIRRKE